jgi:hypothetical protein
MLQEKLFGWLWELESDEPVTRENCLAESEELESDRVGSGKHCLAK